MSVARQSSFHVVFRVDASIEIGTGHVMRCLALADVLRSAGAVCEFVSRELPGHLHDVIVNRQHRLSVLPPPDSNGIIEGVGPDHAEWLGVDWRVDAVQTRQLLGGKSVDWLVVDHYALDAKWEFELATHCRRLMVIDDIADRSHVCDLLLDQNLGRSRSDYKDLVPTNCELLIGPEFALLRPEFAALRQKSLKRRQVGELRHMLVSLGGVDKDNVTGNVIEGLHKCISLLPEQMQITIIMGSHAPWLERVRVLAEQLPLPSQVRVGVSNMAEFMMQSDLAVGATGSTSWERCCLGLPTISAVIADNQVQAARALDRFGAAIDLGSAGSALPDQLATALRMIQKPGALAAISRRSAEVCDGCGAPRVLDILIQKVFDG